jgi:hypothetical protein
MDTEFELIKDTFVENNKDFKIKYATLWQTYLDAYTDYGDLNGKYFDNDNNGEYIEGAVSEIRIRKWLWKSEGEGKVLIDINAWPGDNEDGAVWLDDKIVFLNSDADLTDTPNCPQKLEARLETFMNLRDL